MDMVYILADISGPQLPNAMKPTRDFHQLTDSLFVWHDYNPECKTDCSSSAVLTPEGFVLIDPIRLEEQALERMVGHNRVIAVLLTSGNHVRGSAYEKERLDVPIYAPQGAKDELTADYWVKEGEVLFQTIKAIGLPGGAAGETAYLTSGVLVMGDAVVNLDGLEILPDKYCENPRLLRESLRVISSLDFQMVCFAHGLPLVEQAKEKLVALVGPSALG